MTRSIIDLLERRDPQGIVLETTGRRSLTTARCAELLERLAPTIAGLARGGRTVVAIVLPHSAELATCIMAVASVLDAAPLNPRSTTAEFAVTLRDLDPCALITSPGTCPAAEHAAGTLGIPIVALTPDESSPAGWFDLDTASSSHTRSPVSSSDLSGAAPSLVLHTSGTTAQPKQVALTSTQLTSSAIDIASTLGLGQSDRTVAMMPLFHIHGIVGTLLASVAAGAAVVIDAAFDPFRFERALSDSRATWVSAVPTMYQAMMMRARSTPPPRLRFARSSSAVLHDTVWTALEERLECPVLNSYGMTEASHQVSTNRPPPGQRRLGTVGWGSATEVAVLGEDGRVGTGGTGEVVIRGVSVIERYARPESANDDAFIDGWFRTGDIGNLDPDGCVTLVGRSKEMINVGGEKVSPFEVDAALLAHPGVVQAVAFASADPLLGECVHAAVIVDVDRRGEIDEAALKRFVRDRVSKAKTPQRIFLADEMPTGATGKISRATLGARLGV